MADLTGGSDLGSKTSICGDYGRLREARAVIIESISLSVAASVLVICSVEAMIKAPSLEVQIASLQLTLSSSYTNIGR